MHSPLATNTLDISWAIVIPILSCQWTCTSQPISWSLWDIAKITTWIGTSYVLGVRSQLSRPCPFQTQHLNGLSLQFSGTLSHSRMSTSAKRVLKLWWLVLLRMARTKWLCGSWTQEMAPSSAKKWLKCFIRWARYLLWHWEATSRHWLELLSLLFIF
jgi:hypothetical protein